MEIKQTDVFVSALWIIGLNCFRYLVYLNVLTPITELSSVISLLKRYKSMSVTKL